MAFGPVVQTPVEDAELVSEDGIEVEIVEDGEEDFFEEEAPPLDHYANLAEEIEDDEKNKISSELLEAYDQDVKSRSDWADAYAKGLDLLGMKVEARTSPWQGASGVFHPILTETIIRFQAQAMGELFPASGPARMKLVGTPTPELMKQGERVEKEINYQTTEEMEEYRDETEQMLFGLPLAGTAFKKIFYDPILSRPTSMYVPAEDLVVSYGATNLAVASRYTHVMKKTPVEIEQLQHVGFYSDVDLGTPAPEYNDIKTKYDEIEGSKPSVTDDDRHTILEIHVNLDMPEPFEDEDGLSRPYIVTIDKSSTEVLAIRRNWLEDDSQKKKRQHFVHYKYLPGMGFYGTGLIHILGGLTRTATSILRQLIDAGTLANLPAGLKTRGLRIKGDNTPFYPGEFRDVDVPGGTIKDNVAFLPFKEPSTVLYQLLGNVVEEARRIGSVADTELTKLSGEMPVGTTFAILEKQMKVMSGIQARLHASLKKELKLISNIIYSNMDEVYAWDAEGDFSRTEDFDGRVDVIPVSDPNAATTAQRVVSHQAALELSQSAPHLYNMGKLHRQMLDVLGIDNAEEIVKLPEDINPSDPVTENMAILKQEPVKVFAYQDHEAHIRVHMAAAQDPKILQMVGQSPFASAIQAAMASHITEHVAHEYRKQIEKQLGVSLPDPEAPMPDDVEVEVSRLAADAADKLLGKHKAEAAHEEAMKQQADPLTQIQQKELALKEQKQKNDNEIELMKVQLDAVRSGANIAHMRERLTSEEARAAITGAIKLATELDKETKTAIEGAKLGISAVKELKGEADEQQRGRTDKKGTQE